MDLWVIAAATVAGYIAKLIRNSAANRKESLGLQCSYDVQSEPNSSMHVKEYSEVDEQSDDDALVGTNDFERRVTVGNPRKTHQLSIRHLSTVRSRIRLSDVRMPSQNYKHYELYKETWQKDGGLKDVSRKHSFNDRGDSISGRWSAMLPFAAGLTMGIIFAAKTWEKETEQQKDAQARNLLLDGLEAKEKLVFEDLAIVSTEERVEQSDADALMSRIEGELRFELEVLEQSLDASSKAEIDSDLEELEVVRGDLKMAGEIAEDSSYEPEEEKRHTCSNNNNPQPPLNYSVPPWELTLRLHEVLESRLIARIEVLEKALNSQGVIFREIESESHNLVPHNRFVGMRNAAFGSSHPQVYEAYNFNGSVGTVEDKNQGKKNEALSTKALHQGKPFIRPKI